MDDTEIDRIEQSWQQGLREVNDDPTLTFTLTDYQRAQLRAQPADELPWATNMIAMIQEIDLRISLGQAVAIYLPRTEFDPGNPEKSRYHAMVNSRGLVIESECCMDTMSVVTARLVHEALGHWLSDQDSDDRPSIEGVSGRVVEKVVGELAGAFGVAAADVTPEVVDRVAMLLRPVSQPAAGLGAEA